MRALERWFQRESLREERAVFLEDALLSGRFTAYALYRLRFYLGRFLVAVTLFFVEFTFLAFIFSQRELVSALLVRTASSFLNAWWWGALESMRGQLRSLHREGKTHLIARSLSRWYCLALVCSATTLVLTVGWIVLDISRPTRTFGVLHMYVFAMGLRLSLNLLARTFHSVVYAIRRIYRPFLTLVGVQLLGFVGTLLAWPVLGEWSFPIMLVPMGILANTFTVTYVHRVYRFLGLGPVLPASESGLIGALRRTFTREFCLAGFAYAFMRLDTVLVLAMCHGAYGDRRGYELFLVAYLLGPFIRAAYEWAQLFYFDLKRLELDLFVKLKENFARFVSRVALVVGGLLCALACICGTLLLGRNLGWLYLLLACFFLIRPQLAFAHIRAFTEGRYRILVATGIFVLAGVFLARSLLPGETERLGFFVASLFCAAFCLRPRGLADPRFEQGAEMLSLPDWLARLKSLRRPVRLRSASVARDVDDWLVNRIAVQISRSIRYGSSMTLLGDGRIAWYELETARGIPSDAWILRRGAGLVDGLQSGPYAGNGTEALAAAQPDGILGPLVSEQWPMRGRPHSIHDIKRRFQAKFPGGLLYDAAERTDTRLRNLSSADRREIMYGAIQYSKNLTGRPRKTRYDVTTLCDRGEIRLIFAIPQLEPRKARQDWLSFIDAANVRGAIGAGTKDGAFTTMGPTRLRRMLFWIVPVAALAAVLGIVQIEDRATGPFQLRSVVRAEVRAPVAGFLRAVEYDQGDRISAGALIARLHIPDLAGRIGRKRAEIKEVKTALRLLENQVRPERLAEQRTRIEKSGSRRDRARRELEHSRRAREGGEPLPTGGRADDRAEFEAEGQEDPRASRLPDARAVAEGARIGRLNEELRYLETLERQLSVSSPVDGLIITPRLAEKVGRYFHKGELICVVVEPSVLEGEIVLPEQKVGRVKLGQTIVLKARALPYQTFQAKVDRIAPVAEPGERQSTTTVYCQFERPAAELRPGMSGYARICVGRSSVGSFLVDRVMRFVRTEFWW